MNSTIRKVHEKCFEILEDYFGHHYKQMTRKKQSLNEAVYKSCEAYNNKLAESVCDTLNQELMNLDWQASFNSIQQLRGTKILLEVPNNVALAKGSPIRKVSLYADTIVVVGIVPSIDEYVRIYKTAVPEETSWESRIFFNICNAISLLAIRNLFFADVEKPIIALSTPPTFLTSDLVELCYEISEHDDIALCSHIFGQKFSSFKEFQDFVFKQKSINGLVKRVKRPEFFGAKAETPIKDVLQAHMWADIFSSSPTKKRLTDPQRLVQIMRTNIVKGMVMSTAGLIDCSKFKAEPTTFSNADWQLLRWRFSRDNEILSKEFGMDKVSAASLVLNALRLDDFRWFGNVPIEGIIRMRESGELQNMRGILSRGIREIETVSDEDFVKVTKQVNYNLNQAFKRHRAQVKSLDEKFRRKYNFDVASLTVGGSICAVSAFFPPLAYIGGIIGGGSIIQIIRHIEEERSKREELQRKPIGLLFQAYQDSKKPKI